MASGYSFWEAVTNPGELNKLPGAIRAGAEAIAQYSPDYNKNRPDTLYPTTTPTASPTPTAAIPAPTRTPASRMTMSSRGAQPSSIPAANEQAIWNETTPAYVRAAGDAARRTGRVTEFTNADANGYAGSMANVVPAAQAGAMLSTMMNPKGDQAMSGALRAAAARGDWDAVGRYYASQGQTFGGKMYGTGGGADMDQLYRTAMGLDGTGPQSYRKRDRAATILNQLSNQQNQYDIANLGAEAQRFGAEQVAKVGQERNKVYEAMNLGAQRQRMAAANIAQDQKFLEWLRPQGAPDKFQGLKPDSKEYKALKMRERAAIARTMGFDPYDTLAEDTGKANGGLVEGYARGGQVQPVLNPMGNMGMPSSMADLDPVIRQYAQYVSTASQYGLQPVAFPKFIDLLGTARTQLASLPTQGGATGFANGGMVDWLKSFLPGVGPLDTPAPAATPAQTDQQRLGQGAAMLGSGMAGQAAQALQGRKSALEEALQAAQGARGGYAMGGAIPVAGRQVLGPGGPKSDSIPAVIDGSRPAGLSTGEFVMPTEAVQFYGTDKLNKMIQKARGQ